MIATDNTTNIQILGKTYQIKCPPEKVYELQQAAQLLDRKLRDVSQQGNMRNTEHAAMMAALNISHDLVIAKKQTEEYVKNMHRVIEQLSEA